MPMYSAASQSAHINDMSVPCLQAEDVCFVVKQLLQQVLLAVVPCESPVLTAVAMCINLHATDTVDIPSMTADTSWCMWYNVACF